MTTGNRVIETKSVTKVYQLAEEVHALRGVSTCIDPGEMVAIMGSSGSGKSTLMNILGCLDRPTDGSYQLDGVDVSKLNRSKLADIRNQKIGFVFQGFNLLSRTTALENVQLPLLYNRVRRIRNAPELAAKALERVGLGERLDHHPAQLSGGQQQRVAIARALVNTPAMILADEPTGNLDSKTTIEIMGVLQELNEQRITVVLVTHEPDVARYCSRVIELRDGLVIRDEAMENRRNAAADLEEFHSVTGI